MRTENTQKENKETREMKYYTLTKQEIEKVNSLRNESNELIDKIMNFADGKKQQGKPKAAERLYQEIKWIEKMLSHDESSVEGGDFEIWSVRVIDAINRLSAQYRRMGGKSWKQKSQQNTLPDYF